MRHPGAGTGGQGAPEIAAGPPIDEGAPANPSWMRSASPAIWVCLRPRFLVLAILGSLLNGLARRSRRAGTAEVTARIDVWKARRKKVEVYETARAKSFGKKKKNKTAALLSFQPWGEPSRCCRLRAIPMTAQGGKSAEIKQGRGECRPLIVFLRARPPWLFHDIASADRRRHSGGGPASCCHLRRKAWRQTGGEILDPGWDLHGFRALGQPCCRR